MRFSAVRSNTKMTFVLEYVHYYIANDIVVTFSDSSSFPCIRRTVTLFWILDWSGIQKCYLFPSVLLEGFVSFPIALTFKDACPDIPELPLFHNRCCILMKTLLNGVGILHAESCYSMTLKKGVKMEHSIGRVSLPPPKHGVITPQH